MRNFRKQSSLTKVSEGNTEDNDEEDNDDDEEKLSPGDDIDPDRLKAFNVSRIINF